MSISSNFPNVTPSVVFDFENNDYIDSRIKFFRNSSATFVGPDGLIEYCGYNTPRIHHNPSTGKREGLLIEASQTNYVAYSNVTNWIAGGNITATANQEVSPDGTTTATLIANTGISNPVLYRSLSGEPAGKYTFSCFAKANNSDVFYLRLDISTGVDSCLFRLQGDGFIIQNSTAQTAKIEKYNNGWYRCSFTLESSTNITNYVIGSDTSHPEASVFVWGAQLEVGDYASSLIPTDGGSASRAVEYGQIDGAIVKKFLNKTEGTILANFEVHKGYFPISLGYDSSNYLALFYSEPQVAYFQPNIGSLTHPNFVRTIGRTALPAKYGISYNGYSRPIVKTSFAGVTNTFNNASGGTSFLAAYDNLSFRFCGHHYNGFTDQASMILKQFYYYSKDIPMNWYTRNT